MRSAKAAQSFRERLERVLDVGNLRVADLARWFDRPYSTVKSWMLGHEPMGPPGDLREVFAALVRLEAAIIARELPLPRMPAQRRLKFLAKLKGKMKRRT